MTSIQKYKSLLIFDEQLALAGAVKYSLVFPATKGTIITLYVDQKIQGSSQGAIFLETSPDDDPTTSDWYPLSVVDAGSLAPYVGPAVTGYISSEDVWIRQFPNRNLRLSPRYTVPCDRLIRIGCFESVALANPSTLTISITLVSP